MDDANIIHRESAVLTNGTLQARVLCRCILYRPGVCVMYCGIAYTSVPYRIIQRYYSASVFSVNVTMCKDKVLNDDPR